MTKNKFDKKNSIACRLSDLSVIVIDESIIAVVVRNSQNFLSGDLYTLLGIIYTLKQSNFLVFLANNSAINGYIDVKRYINIRIISPYHSPYKTVNRLLRVSGIISCILLISKLLPLGSSNSTVFLQFNIIFNIINKFVWITLSLLNLASKFPRLKMLINLFIWIQFAALSFYICILQFTSSDFIIGTKDMINEVGHNIQLPINNMTKMYPAVFDTVAANLYEEYSLIKDNVSWTDVQLEIDLEWNSLCVRLLREQLFLDGRLRLSKLSGLLVSVNQKDLAHFSQNCNMKTLQLQYLIQKNKHTQNIMQTKLRSLENGEFCLNNIEAINHKILQSFLPQEFEFKPDCKVPLNDRYKLKYLILEDLHKGQKVKKIDWTGTRVIEPSKVIDIEEEEFINNTYTPVSEHMPTFI